MRIHVHSSTQFAAVPVASQCEAGRGAHAHDQLTLGVTGSICLGQFSSSAVNEPLVARPSVCTYLSNVGLREVGRYAKHCGQWPLPRDR